MSLKLKLGELVVSTAGRDLGEYYIVVGFEDDKFAKLADGDTRRIERPKKKNLKHLKSIGFVCEEFTIRLVERKRIRNEDLKKTIKGYVKTEEGK